MSSVHLPGVPDETVIGLIWPGELAELGILEAVPILEVRWFDERQTCLAVLEYLLGERQGTPADYEPCYFFRAGQCRRNGRESANLCLFCEPESSRGWQSARQWTLVTMADGSKAVARREYAAEIQAEILAEQEAR